MVWLVCALREGGGGGGGGSQLLTVLFGPQLSLSPELRDGHTGFFVWERNAHKAKFSLRQGRAAVRETLKDSPRGRELTRRGQHRPPCPKDELRGLSRVREQRAQSHK